MNLVALLWLWLPIGELGSGVKVHTGSPPCVCSFSKPVLRNQTLTSSFNTKAAVVPRLPPRERASRAVKEMRVVQAHPCFALVIQRFEEIVCSLGGGHHLRLPQPQELLVLPHRSFQQSNSAGYVSCSHNTIMRPSMLHTLCKNCSTDVLPDVVTQILLKSVLVCTADNAARNPIQMLLSHEPPHSETVSGDFQGVAY